MKINRLHLILLFLTPTYLCSNSTFIVTEVETDKILFIENEEYSRKKLFPGSLLKPLTLLSIDNSRNIKYSCSGWHKSSSRCWSKQSHGEIGLIEALAYSCNSYFIQYLKGRVDLKKNYLNIRRYLNFTGKFSEKEYIEESIGLGTKIKSTPLEVLFAYNRLFRERPRGIEVIRQGMKECAYYGTGSLFPDITGIVDVACKTGTSYRIKPDGTYDWRNNTGWFLVLYPADDPKYSFLTVVDITRDKLAVKSGSSNFLRWLNEN